MQRCLYTGSDSSLLGTMTVGGGSSISLFLLSEVRVFALHLLDHHDGQSSGVARSVEISRYWFLVADVTTVSIEADMERVMCLSHVLQLALTLDDVDEVSRFAS